MFRIDLYPTTGPVNASTRFSSLFTPDIFVERWSHRMNAPGTLVFSMQATNPKATPLRLLQKRRVVLLRDGVPEWPGYIDDVNEVDGRLEVVCNGALGILTGRQAGENRVMDGQGSADVFSLLDDVNGEEDCSISEGTGGVTDTSDVQLQGRVDALSAIEQKALSVGAEFQVDTGFALNFVSSLGTNKTSQTPLIFRRDGQPGTNTNALRIAESGRNMATRIIGVSSAGGGMTFVYDSPNQATYGLIEEVKQFNEAQDSGTLEEMTTTYGQQRENPIPDLQLSPLLERNGLNIREGTRGVKGFAFSDFVVGDLRTVQIATENRNVNVAKRIAEIEVSVDENGRESMALTLSEAGVFITADYLDATRIDDLSRRVRQIEVLL